MTRALSHRLPPRRRGARRRRPRRGSPRSSSGWRRSAPRSARTCSPTSRPSRCSSKDEADLAGLPDFMREADEVGRAASAGSTATWSRCRARASSRSCNFPTGAICARKSFRGFVSARRQWRRDRQQGNHRRDGAAARRAGEASRLCRLRPLPARRRHGEDAGGGARSARSGVGAGARARARRPRRHAGADRRGRRQLQARAWDWRYYAEKLRQRRCDFDEAAIKPYLKLDRIDRGGVRHRAAAVRPELHAAPRRAGLASRRAGLGGARRRRPARSGCSSAIISPAPPSAAAPG